MAKRHYIATVRILLELDDAIPGMGNDEATACDAISEWLREAPEFLDWGYAVVDNRFLSPAEVAVDTDTYAEGDLYGIEPNLTLV